MRWERLFADLETQAEACARDDSAARTADLLRVEQAGIALADRLRGSRGAAVVLGLADGVRVSGHLREVADEWALLVADGREVVVPTSAVDTVTGLPPRAVQSSGVGARLSLGHVLRGLARDRALVVVRTRGGAMTGRIERVGRDHLDLDTSAAREGSPRTQSRAACVRFGAILSVAAASV